MLTTIFVSVVLVASCVWAVCFVRLLYNCSLNEREQQPAPTDDTLAVSKEHLENVIQSRQDTLELIQNTDLRLRSFDMLPGEQREVFPESYDCAKAQNYWAKQAYDDYDFEIAARFAQAAAKEIQLAQQEINQSGIG